ncbi:MAG TPA: helix-turn-helix domain-containing protein [Solirubrobacteraceae bacterium]|nr:helix-turn-helix domain-containing protein [Solirubrobacteraceae bacterium]
MRARQVEIEERIFARIRDGAQSPAGGDDAEYAAGLRATVQAAVEHALDDIELGEDGARSVPPEAVAQARRAARVGVSLDTVLRRYVLGSSVLGDFVMQEADHCDLVGMGTLIRDVLSAQAAVLDRLMTTITGEYIGELEQTGRSAEQRRGERVLGLLAGGRGGTTELGYELDGWHVGAIASGDAATETLRRCAGELGVPLLCVRRGEDTVWGWLGGQCSPSARDIEVVLSEGSGTNVSFAIGEPAHGIDGWRLTHQQAQAALRVALRSPRRLTRYADVALLASVLHDDALAGSMAELYLAPLGDRENGGGVLRKTLRAYFAAERNASSAASALGVTRHTVQNRLRTIEEKLGQTLRTRQAELEIALRLEDLNRGLGS